ncbi:FG-GAP-like repeat-containing protein, partial [Paenibacillus sp. y28]|uniref:FG-GAP-like repeat-containing protein n=1 Tax=Paenibacillus sp. y28 TaxID=3129110 RepID=UPI00301A29DF
MGGSSQNFKGWVERNCERLRKLNGRSKAINPINPIGFAREGTMKQRNSLRKKLSKVSACFLALTLTVMSSQLLELKVLASSSALSAGSLPITDSGTTNAIQFQVGDFDNDGDIDILTQDGGTGTSITFWENNGSGSFTDSGTGRFTGSLAGLAMTILATKVADFDNDGDLDIYCRVSGASNDVYFVNDGSGNFSPGTLPIPDSGTGNPVIYAVGDFDNDGDIDILTQDGGAGTSITFWKNDGSGVFADSGTGYFPATLTGLNINSTFTKVADFDNDGDLDIYSRVSGASNDWFLENNGSGTFTSGTLPILDSGTSNAVCYNVGDFDNDGDIDILTQDGGAGTDVTFWENDGSGTYSNSGTGRMTGISTGVNLAITSSKIADFDSDGDLDIYSRVSGATNDKYYVNDTKPPLVTASIPGSNGTNVGVSDNITLSLSNSSSVSKGSGTIMIKVDDGDGNFLNDTTFESIPVTDTRVSITGDSSSSTVTINPSGTFASNTTYYLVVPPTVFLDAEGRGFVSFAGSRFHPGIPDPARKQAGNSLHSISDRTVLSFTTGSAALSSDATLKASSTVKGQTASLGTPDAAWDAEAAGSVTLTAEQAADTSNMGSYITRFEQNDSHANVKVVKYASGSTPTAVGFDGATAYANEAVSNGDFFIIKVVAQDGATVLYYKVNVIVNAAPTYTASVSPSSKAFPAATAGYGAQTAQEITITNTGSGTITGLAAALGGTDYEISTALSATSINAGDTATVSVRPKTGLTADTYTDTLTITGDNGVSQTVSLSFTVNAAPTYTASVSPSSKAFPAATAGYGAQTAQEITITNTGTGTITGLAAALGGTD